MSLWFRWYEGTTEDGKFRVISRNASVTLRDVIALWAFILEDASSDKHRGICKRNEDFMASVLDFRDGEVEKILESMEEQELISVGHGEITICNWGKRQFESDKSDGTNAERQRRYRERRKKTDAKRDSNGSVTATKRPETETEKKDAADAALPSDLERQLFSRGKEIAGKDAGGLIVKLLKAKKGDVALARSAVELASTKQNPREFIAAIVTGGKASVEGRRLTNDEEYYGVGRTPGVV